MVAKAGALPKRLVALTPTVDTKGGVKAKNKAAKKTAKAKLAGK